MESLGVLIYNVTNCPKFKIVTDTEAFPVWAILLICFFVIINGLVFAAFIFVHRKKYEVRPITQLLPQESIQTDGLQQTSMIPQSDFEISNVSKLENKDLIQTESRE